MSRITRQRFDCSFLLPRVFSHMVMVNCQPWPMTAVAGGNLWSPAPQPNDDERGTLAQLVRALTCSAEGPGIEICTEPKNIIMLRLTSYVYCVLGQGTLYSHVSRSPEHIKQVSFVGKYYNLSADRACT